MKKRKVPFYRRAWFGAGIVGLIVVGALASPFESNSDEIAYTFVKLGRGEVVRVVSASGILSALVTVEVGTQLSGQITELHADFNSEVKRGDLIALIDPQTFRSRVLQATAEVRVASANLEIQQAGVTLETANLRAAERDYDRKEALADEGFVSTADLDTSLAALETARARIQMAEAQVSNARATFQQREASLAQAEIDLGRTEIRAPVDGVVIERNVDIGQTVAASFSAPVLFQIAQDLREMQVEASIDEADIGEIREGNSVTFSVDAYPDREFKGNVRQIRKAPVTLDNVTTYTVVITARNDDLRLLPGMTADVEVVTGRVENVLRVANSALRFRPRSAPGEADQPSGGPQAGGGGQQAAGGRQGGGFGIDRITGELNLSDEQEAAVRQGMQSMRGSINFAPGGDPQAIRQQFQTRLAEMLSSILTPEQMAKYRDLTENQRNVRRGQIWYVDDNGELTSANVALGISDDNYTEIIRTRLNENTDVISGATRVSAAGR